MYRRLGWTSWRHINSLLRQAWKMRVLFYTILLTVSKNSLQVRFSTSKLRRHAITHTSTTDTVHWLEWNASVYVLQTTMIQFNRQLSSTHAYTLQKSTWARGSETSNLLYCSRRGHTSSSLSTLLVRGSNHDGATRYRVTECGMRISITRKQYHFFDNKRSTNAQWWLIQVSNSPFHYSHIMEVRISSELVATQLR